MVVRRGGRSVPGGGATASEVPTRFFKINFTSIPSSPSPLSFSTKFFKKGWRYRPRSKLKGSIIKDKANYLFLLSRFSSDMSFMPECCSDSLPFFSFLTVFFGFAVLTSYSSSVWIFFTGPIQTRSSSFLIRIFFYCCCLLRIQTEICCLLLNPN